MFNYLILPFNLVVKSATADFVLLNSVLVEAKFVFVFSNSVDVTEQFNSIKIKSISNKQKYFYLSDVFSNFLQQLLILVLIDPNSLHNLRKQIKIKTNYFSKNFIVREIYF